MKRIIQLQALALLCLTGAATADVVLDNMQGSGNRNTAGGVIFVVADTAGGSTWTYPDIGFSYWNLADGGPAPGAGKVTYLHGTVGGKGDFPHLTYGMYFDNPKSVLDLSWLTGIALRVRGVGLWRTKIKCNIIDSLAIADLGRKEDQVAWKYSLTGLSSTEFQWVVITPEQLSSNVGAMNLLLTQKGISKRDVLKTAWKYYIQTDGYTSADAGTEAWIQISDIIFLGPQNSIGASIVKPTPAQCAEIGACSGGSSILSRGISFSNRMPTPQSHIFALDGRFLGKHGSLSQTASLPKLYLNKDEGKTSLHSSLSGR